MRTNLLKKISQCSQVTDKLLCLRSYFMPYGVQLTAHNGIKGSKVCILDIQVVQIKLIVVKV